MEVFETSQKSVISNWHRGAAFYIRDPARRSNVRAHFSFDYDRYKMRFVNRPTEVLLSCVRIDIVLVPHLVTYRSKFLTVATAMPIEKRYDKIPTKT